VGEGHKYSWEKDLKARMGESQDGAVLGKKKVQRIILNGRKKDKSDANDTTAILENCVEKEHRET